MEAHGNPAPVGDMLTFHQVVQRPSIHRWLLDCNGLALGTRHLLPAQTPKSETSSSINKPWLEV